MHSMCVMVVTQCSLLLAVLLAAVAFCDARYGIVEYYILLMRFCVPKRRVGSSAKHKQRCCIATLPHLAVSSSSPCLLQHLPLHAAQLSANSRYCAMRSHIMSLSTQNGFQAVVLAVI